MKNLLWSGFFIVLLLSGCSNGTPTRINDITPLTSIEIKAEALTSPTPTIAALTSTKLTVTGNYMGLFKRDITDAVWSIDAPAVAKFVFASDPNRVKGLSQGTANLTATVKSVTGELVSATFTLKVTSATIKTISIIPDKPTIAKGHSIQFAAKGSFSDNTIQDLTFDADWTSSLTTVATVSNDPASKGLAQTSQTSIPGVTDITATFNSVPGTTQLAVTAPALTSITVSTTTSASSVLSLSKVQFKATAKYSDGTTPDITNLVTWTSSDTSLATIVPNTGMATTLAQGKPTISATMGSVTGTFALNVTGGNLQSITVKPVSLTGSDLTSANFAMAPNTSVRISATGTFNTGASRDISGMVTWATGNASLATVSAPGGNLAWLSIPPAATAGSTTVTATYGTIVSPAITLTITTANVLNVTVSPTTNLALPVGASTRFTATANFNDGKIEDVTANTSCTWAATPASPVTIGTGGLAGGQVTGVASGTATITPTFGGSSAATVPTVNVTTPTLQSLDIVISGTLAAGNQVAYTMRANYNDGTIIDVTEKTTWSIDTPNVAILADSANQPGQVVGVNTGTATLTAKFLGQTVPTTISVP